MFSATKLLVPAVLAAGMMAGAIGLAQPPREGQSDRKAPPPADRRVPGNERDTLPAERRGPEILRRLDSALKAASSDDEDKPGDATQAAHARAMLQVLKGDPDLVNNLLKLAAQSLRERPGFDSEQAELERRGLCDRRRREFESRRCCAGRCASHELTTGNFARHYVPPSVPLSGLTILGPPYPTMAGQLRTHHRLSHSTM